jgi:hypothetical protein
MRLYIDDIRNPKGIFDHIARTSEDAMEWMIRNGCPTEISFDHDLGGDDTAMIVVKWMVDMDLNTDGDFIPEEFTFYVHSANPIGKLNIEGYLNNYLRVRGDF